jgi:hypothetical protein
MEDLTTDSMLEIRGGFHLAHHKHHRHRRHIVSGEHATQINQETVVGSPNASVVQTATASAGNLED